MTRAELEKLLDSHYSRYTVKTYTDRGRAGVIDIWLPGKIVSFVFGYKLDLIKPVNVLVTTHRLPWWKNWVIRRKWRVV